METIRKVEQEGSRTEQKEYNGMQEVSAEADKSPSDISSWALAPRALTQSLNLTSSVSGLRDVRGTRVLYHTRKCNSSKQRVVAGLCIGLTS